MKYILVNSSSKLGIITGMLMMAVLFFLVLSGIIGLGLCFILLLAYFCSWLLPFTFFQTVMCVTGAAIASILFVHVMASQKNEEEKDAYIPRSTFKGGKRKR